MVLHGASADADYVDALRCMVMVAVVTTTTAVMMTITNGILWSMTNGLSVPLPDTKPMFLFVVRSDQRQQGGW